MRLAGNVVYRRQKSNAKRILMEKWKERDHLKRLGADGKIILKRKYEKRMKGVDWIYLAREKDKQVTCENGIDISGFIEFGEFII
jgi:hypothetical protein